MIYTKLYTTQPVHHLRQFVDEYAKMVLKRKSEQQGQEPAEG